MQSTRSELDVGIIDDWTQNVSGLLDQLDHDLEQAKMGSGRMETAVAAMKTAMEKVGLPTMSRTSVDLTILAERIADGNHAGRTRYSYRTECFGQNSDR